MFREYFSGTVVEKMFTIFNYFYQLKFPLNEFLSKMAQHSNSIEPIDTIEVIFYREGGRQFVIEFNSAELCDILSASHKKKRIRELECDKKIIIKKIRRLHDDIVLLENTE